MSRFSDTIAALATPVGTAAIAVVRVSGVDTPRLVREIFGVTPLPRTMQRGDYRDRAGALLDDVLFVYFQAPKSYTAEDVLEISCHGNPFIAQRIVEDLFARGCRPATPGEFTQRAFVNGRMDLSQAEAVMDLIHARSDRALAAANQQLRGALGRRIEGMIQGLLNVVARVEAYIDFPEEDLPVEDQTLVIAAIDRLLLETSGLLATNHYGDLLREGIRTVILGAPNVGKSSLLNRLVGRDRALVSAEPGTTRDFIEERIVVGPHCLRLIDTAGLSAAPAPLEKLGMEKTMERAVEADLFVAVMDATVSPPYLPAELLPLLEVGKAVVVLNKIDLVQDVPQPAGFEGLPIVRVSAVTGVGLDELSKAITACADAFQPDVGSEMVAINARHAHALQTVAGSLRAAREKLRGGEPTELLASDLRDAMAALGEIGGKIDNERMLDQLFATFCIGK